MRLSLTLLERKNKRHLEKCYQLSITKEKAFLADTQWIYRTHCQGGRNTAFLPPSFITSFSQQNFYKQWISFKMSLKKITPQISVFYWLSLICFFFLISILLTVWDANVHGWHQQGYCAFLLGCNRSVSSGILFLHCWEWSQFRFGAFMFASAYKL